MTRRSGGIDSFNPDEGGVFGVIRRHSELKTGVIAHGAIARKAFTLGALPLAIAIACAGVAHAAPQPGVTTPAQPGVTTPDSSDRAVGPKQPGTTIEPAAPAAPQADYAVPENYRPIPDRTEPAPPVDLQELHLPEPVEPVAPIAPPPRTLRVGDFLSPVPDEVPNEILDPVNQTAATAEAAIATGGKSIGIDPSRSDKIAAATAAGAAGGALVGAAVAGIPAAVVGGVGGAVIGAGVGAVAGTVVAAGIPVATGVIGAVAAAAAGGIATGGPGAIPAVAAGAAAGVAAGLGAAFAIGAPGGAAIGALVGGAIGAAVIGLPAAAVGAAIGGVAGGALTGAWAGANL